jgi:spore germination protein KB
MVHLEDGKIDSNQLTWLVMNFIGGSSVILNPGRFAGRDAWIAVILGLLEGLLLILAFLTLAVRFRGLTLVEICEAVYGSILGKVIAFCYLIYLFHLGSLVLRDFTDFFATLIVPETPPIAILLLLLFVIVLAVKNGIEVIARCSLVLFSVTIIITVSLDLLAFGIFKLENLKPILHTPLPKIIWAAQGTATFPIGETVAFMMIVSFLNRDQKIISPVIKGILVVIGIFTIVAIRNIGVLGITESIYTYPSVQVARLIFNPYIDIRLEILMVIAFLNMGLIKMAVLLYGTTLGTAQILKLHSYKLLTLPIGILMVILSLVNFSSIMESLRFAQIGYPIWAMPFQLGIPLATLFIAVIRKLPRRNSKSSKS